MVTVPAPRRGEIWLVDFDPAVADEIRKRRPALVVNLDSIGRLPLRIVVPITDWKAFYQTYPWFVRLSATPANGLLKESGADTFQIKSLSTTRFVRRLGVVASAELAAVCSAIALCVDAP